MKKFYLFAVLAIIGLQLNANNITVSNATCTGQNTGASPKYTMVKFNLSWENSWRMSAGPANWDAAWVFVKYKVQGGNWAHATLAASGHSITSGTPSGMTITTPSDKKGVFIYRSTDGTGSVSLTDVLLQWNYGTDGVADAANIQVQVFAVEMVYIPQGPFFIGDGNISLAPSASGFKINNTGNTMPYKVTSEAAITFCNSTYSNTDQVYDSKRINGYTLIANYPKGYAAFYTMKYEMSQKQYVDFFNTLPKNLTVENARNISGGTRNDFAWGGSVNDDAYITSPKTGDRACNYLSAMDAAAYADWACLRPMSELEYEKMSRGCDNGTTPIFPTNLEYAWGNTTINNITASLLFDGYANEGIANPGTAVSNCNYSGGSPGGPVRCGIFAAKGWTSDQRTQSGASYYGVMELSGNVSEILMVNYNYSNTYNTVFDGAVGDGALNVNGNSDISTWAQNGSAGGSEVNSTYCYTWGSRGGCYNLAASYCMTSDRYYVSSPPASRSSNYGFRACRKP